jgi:hypothetical protein
MRRFFRSRLQVRVSDPGSAPVPEYPHQITDGRDPGPGVYSRHPPPEAATCHPRMNAARAARGAAPTSIQLCRHAVPTLPVPDSRRPNRRLPNGRCPGGRHLSPGNRSPANHPVSGLPLSSVSSQKHQGRFRAPVHLFPLSTCHLAHVPPRNNPFGIISSGSPSPTSSAG